MDEKNILKRLLKEGNKVLIEIYRKYRIPFIKWAKTYYNVNEADAKDIFQEVILTFYDNVVNFKLITLDSSLKTYLFSIGKNMLLNRNRKQRQQKVQLMDSFDHLNLEDWDLDLDIYEEKSKKIEVIISAYNELGEMCKEILKLFYFEKLPHKEIKIKLNYKSVEVSRTRKRNCVNQLKNKIL